MKPPAVSQSFRLKTGRRDERWHVRAIVDGRHVTRVWQYHKQRWHYSVESWQYYWEMLEDSISDVRWDHPRSAPLKIGAVS